LTHHYHRGGFIRNDSLFFVTGYLTLCDARFQEISLIRLFLQGEKRIKITSSEDLYIFWVF
jgi:hypothetical protein